MSTDLIAAIAAGSPAAGAAPALPAFGGDAAVARDFSAWLNQEVSQLNQTMLAAEGKLQDQAAGRTQNLHEVMIALEESRLALQLAMQVRNKVLDAYQELMRMQI